MKKGESARSPLLRRIDKPSWIGCIS